MLEAPLAPYLLWAKTRRPAAIDLAGSNVLACSLKDLPEAPDVVDLSAPNDLGFAPVVEAVAARYGVGTDRVAMAAGCSGANFLVIAALVAAGDRVLVERPTYDPLLGACRLLGAEIIRFDRRPEDGYGVDLDALRALLAGRPRLIVLTSPHNPSGVRLSLADVAAIGALADRTGTHVLMDEVYLDASALVADQSPRPQSSASLDGPFIVTNSLTKSYGLSGLRCGWIIAPAAVAERIRRTRDLVDNSASGPADRLSALALAQLPRLASRARVILSANLARATRFFESQPRLSLASRPSCPIVFPSLIGGDDAAPFVERLLDRHGVAVAPGRYFDAPDRFRIGLGGDSGALERGLTQLASALADWGDGRRA